MDIKIKSLIVELRYQKNETLKQAPKIKQYTQFVQPIEYNFTETLTNKIKEKTKWSY
jgi:hypothetical protein